MDDIKAKITKATDEFFDANETPSEPTESISQAQPVDYYQMQQNAAYEASQKPKTYGSPAQIARVVDKMVEDFKQEYYNVNKNAYDHYLDANAKDQAEYLRQDYMVKSALPLAESIVEMYGADAVLNNKKALDKLDEIMISPNGSGNGFTKGYLKQMHKDQLGSQGSESDAEITYGVARIKQMADSDDIRGSVSEAQRLKEKVDNGELSASKDDYDLLLQVSSYK